MMAGRDAGAAARFVRSSLAGLPTPQDRRARIADPRTAVEILKHQFRITAAECNAGRFFGACATDGGRAAALLYRALREKLEAVEIDLPAMLLAVCVEHRMPKTIAGLERLRRGLRLVAEYRGDLEDEMDLPGFAQEARHDH